MKSNPDCELLEAYLAGDLSTVECAAFEAHLTVCDECRAAIGEQRWIDELLRGPETAMLEPAPQRILVSVEARLRRQWRRHMALIGGGLAAAVIAVMMSMGGADHVAAPVVKPTHIAESIAAVEASVEREHAPPVDTTPAVFFAANDSIVVPVASEYPDVTIVQVYATYQPNAATGAAAELNPHSETDTSLEHTNGG